MPTSKNIEDIEEYFDVCYRLTKECGELIKEAIVKTKQVLTKSSDIDLVTETDQEVERLLIGGLKKAFPTHQFIGEESVSLGEKCVLTDEPTWIIDPVDGTMNFVHGLPLVAISIGLLIEKEAVLGIIYNPVLDQMFTAKIGQGAYLNGERIQVSGETELERALVCSEMGTSKDPERIRIIMSNLGKLVGSVHGLIGTACCALSLVATGSADAFCHFGLHCWDMSASLVIVTEAGGAFLDYGGGPFDLLSRRVVCASSEKLARSIAELLEHTNLERD